MNKNIHTIICTDLEPDDIIAISILIKNGVKPDVYIVPTHEDRLNGKDPELEWILMDIEKDKSYSGSGKANEIGN